jgi:hypothetical protein
MVQKPVFVNVCSTTGGYGWGNELPCALLIRGKIYRQVLGAAFLEGAVGVNPQSDILFVFVK